MKVIGLVGQKGGSGKSTLVRNLSVMAALENYDVLALDTDEQNTLGDWYKDRSIDKKEYSPWVVSTQASHIEDAISKAKEKSFDFVFIDTPGRYASYLDRVIKVADFVLVPCRTTKDDIKAQFKTAMQLKEHHKSFGFVATQSPLRGFRRDVTLQSLEILGTVCPIQIPYLMDFQDGAANGLGVNEMDVNSKASESIKGLWHWIMSQIKENIL